MKAEEYFKHWKKEQGINYVEGQEDLFKFANDYAEELRLISEAQHKTLILQEDTIKRGLEEIGHFKEILNAKGLTMVKNYQSGKGKP